AGRRKAAATTKKIPAGSRSYNIRQAEEGWAEATPLHIKPWRFGLFRSEAAARLRLRGLLLLGDAALWPGSRVPSRGADRAERNSCSLPAQTLGRCARREHRAKRLAASSRETQQPLASQCIRTERSAPRRARRPALLPSSRGTTACARSRKRPCHRQTQSFPAPSVRLHTPAAAIRKTPRGVDILPRRACFQSAPPARPAFRQFLAAIFPLANRGLSLPRPTKCRAKHRPNPADSGTALPAAHRIWPARWPNRPGTQRKRGTNPASRSGPAPAPGALRRPRRRRSLRARRTRALAGRFRADLHLYQFANGSRWFSFLRAAGSRTRGLRRQFHGQIPMRTGLPWLKGGGTLLSCAEFTTKRYPEPQNDWASSTTGLC